MQWWKGVGGDDGGSEGFHLEAWTRHTVIGADRRALGEQVGEKYRPRRQIVRDSGGIGERKRGT